LNALFVAALLACTTWHAYAHGVSTGDLVIDHPFAMPSVVGSPHGAAHFRGIKNKGDKPDRLLSASVSVAEKVTLRHMAVQAGGMRLRDVSAIDLPAGQTTNFRHDGEYQLALIQLKRPLKNGDRFDLALIFERAGSLTVSVSVQTPRTAAVDAEHKH
jgi:copper(I)-binding protein